MVRAVPPDGRRIGLRGGGRKGDATKKLTATRALLDAGAPLDEVLGEEFNDLVGTRLTFRKAVPLYLDYAEGVKRASTLQADKTRLGIVKTAPWASKTLSRVTPRDLGAWLQTIGKDRSGASVNA